MEGLGGPVVVTAIHHLLAFTVGPEALHVQDGVLTVLGEGCPHLKDSERSSSKGLGKVGGGFK